MPPWTSAATRAPKLTLGALHRLLLAQLDSRIGMRIGIHFEERTSVLAEHAPAGSRPERIEQRTFKADLIVCDGFVVQGSLTAGAIGAASLAVRIAEVDGACRYAIGDDGFGPLTARPGVFDLADFEERLDAVAIGDAIVDLEAPGGTGRIILDAEIDTDAFTRLLSVFGGNEPSDPELPLLSHSVTLSAASDVTLDYWWSLLGIDEVEGGPARNNTIVCHVQTSVAALTDAADAAPAAPLDPALPVLGDLDAVWELARQRRPI